MANSTTGQTCRAQATTTTERSRVRQRALTSEDYTGTTSLSRRRPSVARVVAKLIHGSGIREARGTPTTEWVLNLGAEEHSTLCVAGPI
jgi:hypothetical protein